MRTNQHILRLNIARRKTLIIRKRKFTVLSTGSFLMSLNISKSMYKFQHGKVLKFCKKGGQSSNIQKHAIIFLQNSPVHKIMSAQKLHVDISASIGNIFEH